MLKTKRGQIRHDAAKECSSRGFFCSCSFGEMWEGKELGDWVGISWDIIPFG